MSKQTKIKFNIIAIVCIIIFAFSIAPKTLQNDTYYTIKIGEHIMENGIDMKDPFSWSDLRYTYPHWLYDVCMYQVYNLGGMQGIYISTIVLSCLLGVMLYITSSRVNKRPLFSFIITICVLYMVRDFIAARAQLVTFILFVTEILFIESFLETKKVRYVFGLMILAMLIANMHAAVFYFFFILFMPYIAEYIIVTIGESNIISKIKIKNLENIVKDLSKRQGKEEELEEYKKKLEEEKIKSEKIIEKSKQRRENPYKIKLIKRDAAKWLILICILCFAMGLLTPLGDEPYTHLFKLMQGTTTQNISEHQPLVLADHYGAIASVVVLGIFLIFTDTKISLKDLFMIGGLLVLAFLTRRQFSMLVIIGGISFTKLICDFTDKYDKNRSRRIYKASCILERNFTFCSFNCNMFI